MIEIKINNDGTSTQLIEGRRRELFEEKQEKGAKTS